MALPVPASQGVVQGRSGHSTALPVRAATCFRPSSTSHSSTKPLVSSRCTCALVGKAHVQYVDGVASSTGGQRCAPCALCGRWHGWGLGRLSSASCTVKDPSLAQGSLSDPPWGEAPPAWAQSAAQQTPPPGWGLTPRRGWPMWVPGGGKMGVGGHYSRMQNDTSLPWIGWVVKV